MEIRVISIPHNIIVVGREQLGLDAYFWNKLRKVHRRVLLIRKTEILSMNPSGCRLPVEISPLEQIEDLKKIAAGSVSEDSHISLPLSLIRISSLLIPYTIAEKAQDPIVKGLLGTDEITMAVKIAKTLLSWEELKPANKVMWLNVKLLNHNIEDKLLETLRRIDEGFNKNLVKALAACNES